MPKRKIEDKEDKWLRKLKKYELKLQKRQKQNYAAIVYSSDEEGIHPNVPLEDEIPLEDQSRFDSEVTPVAPDEPVASDVPVPEIEVNETAETDIDADMLKLIGEYETESVEWGEKIHEELAKRFQHILQNGLKKEDKENLKKKYLFPENVPFCKAPIINPEINAILVEKYNLRDKRILSKQDFIGKSLTAIGKALTILVKKNPDIPESIRILNDAGKMLAHSHYDETDTRRTIVLPLLDKSLSEPIKDSKRDKFLFGEKLSETIKSTKSIKKTGQMIQSTGTSGTNLNWRGPSSRGSQRGNRSYSYRGGGQRTSFANKFRSPQQQARRQAPPPLLPPSRPPPPPPPRRQPPSHATRGPSSHSRHQT